VRAPDELYDGGGEGHPHQDVDDADEHVAGPLWGVRGSGGCQGAVRGPGDGDRANLRLFFICIYSKSVDRSAIFGTSGNTVN
jgi:hypothetical protein